LATRPTTTRGKTCIRTRHAPSAAWRSCSRWQPSPPRAPAPAASAPGRPHGQASNEPCTCPERPATSTAPPPTSTCRSRARDTRHPGRCSRESSPSPPTPASTGPTPPSASAPPAASHCSHSVRPSSDATAACATHDSRSEQQKRLLTTTESANSWTAAHRPRPSLAPEIATSPVKAYGRHPQPSRPVFDGGGGEAGAAAVIITLEDGKQTSPSLPPKNANRDGDLVLPAGTLFAASPAVMGGRGPCPRRGSTCARREKKEDESIPAAKGRESRTPRTFPCITACSRVRGEGAINRHRGPPGQANPGWWSKAMPPLWQYFLVCKGSLTPIETLT
jgi:hypothetical protein